VFEEISMKRPAKFIGLLRGINVSGRNKIPMSDLRELCAEIGCGDIQSYIQSGNLVFSTLAKPTVVEMELERAIERRFQLLIPVIVRVAADWPAYVKGNPFPEASSAEPNLVMLALAKTDPKPEALSALCDRCTGGERIVQVGDALWIHFAGGVARSKISPALLDRLVGSKVTMRNWRTVLKLGEMVMS
jgi:uncharacterized protein (DUF1697 family)